MDKFFHPRSIAIVGFSAREGNQGQGVLSNMRTYGYRGKIFLVGRSGGEYKGQRVYPSMDDLPEDVDLAVIVTGAHAVPEAMESCGRRGIRHVCVESSGFDEFSPGGSPLTAELRAIAHKWNIRFTGPNGFGVVNLPEGVFTPFGDMTPSWMRPGHVSVLSQSGGLLYHIGCVLTTGGLGIAKGVSMGNKVNMNETDFLPYLLADEDTGIIWLYLESITEGRKLLELSRSSPKPILMLKSGQTQASQQALQSHSAALAGDDRVVSAMARQANIIRVSNFREMVDISKVLSAPPVRGNNLLIFARSGGIGVMAADEAEAHGFRFVDIPDWYAEEIRRSGIADIIRPSNPVDLGTIFDIDRWLYLVEVGSRRLRPDAVVMSYISSPGWSATEAPRLAQGLRDIGRRLEIPLVLVVAAAGEEVAALERDLGIPVYREINDAIQSLAAARDWGQRQKALSVNPFTHVRPGKPPTVPGVSPLLPEALELIEAYGIQAAPWTTACNCPDAVASAKRLGYPLALKVVSANISHKTELGGVVVNISDEAALHQAWEAMQTRLLEDAPGAQIEQFLLQKMAIGGREMIVGARRDPMFGPVVLLGSGGIYAEVFDDVSLRIAPLDSFDAEEMITEIRGYGLLSGVRGEEALDVAAVKHALLAVSRLMLEHPEIQEIDINPLIVLPKGALALDARIINF